MLDPKCIYRKSIFAKCTRLACLLSFASLFCHISQSLGRKNISQYIGCTREAQMRPQIWDCFSTREIFYQERVSRCSFFSRTTWKSENCSFCVQPELRGITSEINIYFGNILAIYWQYIGNISPIYRQYIGTGYENMF